ncbi:MAG: glycosyltransferase [Eubacterium sp.]|nr:glycosyltransferase [Eubacterium sp.]
MNGLVSIIIPIFKVEKYLSRCVDSALNQTYKNIEIILVDDGSPDNCPKICDEYAEKYDKIKVVHKVNGGLSSARNAGLKVATGEYVMFVDSDDWIDANMVADLVEIAEKENVDFVRTRAKYASWSNRSDGSVCDFGIENMMHTGIYDRDAIEKEILPICIATPQITFGPIVSAGGTLYKRELLTKNNIEFYEDVKYSEDCIFNAIVLMNCNSFYYLNEPQYYNYFYNDTSITKSYRADRWSSNKILIKRFEEDFGLETRFDIPNQLWRKKIFCILNSLNERSYIDSFTARRKYCRAICNDMITVNTMKHMEGLDISRKLRIILLLIKYRQAWILALIK